MATGRVVGLDIRSPIISHHLYVVIFNVAHRHLGWPSAAQGLSGTNWPYAVGLRPTGWACHEVVSRYACSASLHSRGGTAIEHVRNLDATVELDMPCTSHTKGGLPGSRGWQSRTFYCRNGCEHQIHDFGNILLETGFASSQGRGMFNPRLLKTIDGTCGQSR